jgi:DnaJ-class molecular chaperone
MAAQRKKHTEAQLSGIRAYHHNKSCPSCNGNKYTVVESRKTFDATRRRYKCHDCDYRQTMYEISSESFEELRSLRSKLRTIKDALADFDIVLMDAPSPCSVPLTYDTIPCLDCVHLTPNGCSFDIPEAQTEEAKGCNLFQAIV